MRRVSLSRRPSTQRYDLVLESSSESRVRSLGKEFEEELLNGDPVQERWVEIGVARKPPQRKVLSRWMPSSSSNSSSNNGSSSSSSSSTNSEDVLRIVNDGDSYQSLVERVEQLESASSKDNLPRFFAGILCSEEEEDFVGYVFQFSGEKNVTSIKVTMAYSNVLSTIANALHADVVLHNVQNSLEISKSKMLSRPRHRTRRRRSGEIKTLKGSEIDRGLTIDFISENEELLNAWNAIRHDVLSQELTWMILGYHENEASRNPPQSSMNTSKLRHRRVSRTGLADEFLQPTSVPLLLAKGGGGIDAFGSGDLLKSVNFRPGWLYWVYARVDVENIEGTGRFRANSSSHDGERKSSFKAGGAKFVLMSFCLPLDQTAMLPSMSYRLLHHRPIVAQVLKYHMYIEARSLSDLSEDSLVNRLVAYSDAGKIILTVFVGSGSGGTLRKLANGASKSMNTPLMIRIDPKATLGELKSRVAAAYSWEPARVVVMQVERRNNMDVMQSLIKSRVNPRSEADLEEVIRKASSQVTAKEMEGDGKSLSDHHLVSGDELYIQLVKNSAQKAEANMTREMNQIGLVERRRRQIEDFLAMRERQQKFRMPMFASLRKIGTNTSIETESDSESYITDDEDELDDSKSVRTGKSSLRRRSRSSAAHSIKSSGSISRRRSHEAKSGSHLDEADEYEMMTPSVAELKSRKKSMLAMAMEDQLKNGLRKLRLTKKTPKQQPPSGASQAEKAQIFNHSIHLLHLLAEEATRLGARIVDSEDFIILNKRVLGDGRTARVREGLLLCKLEELPNPSLRSRKSTVVSTRASWMRMRKSSLAPGQAKNMFAAAVFGASEKDGDGVESDEAKWEEAQQARRNGSRGNKQHHRSSVVSSLPASEQDARLFEFVALKVAVKMFTARLVTKTVFDQFLEEISVLVGLHHASIVQILGVYIDQAPRQDAEPGHTSLMIMYELMPRGSLRQLRETDSWLAIPFSMKLKMALDVARGIDYLHSREPPVAHRDLKSDNLLVDEDFTLKIGDFGISTRVQAGGIHNSKVGTSGWIAPEVLMNRKAGYGIPCDIFSFGIILWELITVEKNPLAGLVEDEYVSCLENGDRPLLPEPVSKLHDRYNQLVRDCWEFEPEDRPTIGDVVECLSGILDEVLNE